MVYPISNGRYCRFDAASNNNVQLKGVWSCVECDGEHSDDWVNISDGCFRLFKMVIEFDINFKHISFKSLKFKRNSWNPNQKKITQTHPLSLPIKRTPRKLPQNSLSTN